MYNYCTFTPLRAPPKISSDEGWKNILTTGVDCVELLRLRLRSSHSNRHQASPAPDQRRGKHWSMMELTWPTATRPRPRLSPLAWLRSPETRRDWHRALSLLPPTPATLPYFVSPLTPQHSSKYCTIFGYKDKTTGSFTINIPKILPYCCTIFRPKGSSKMFDKLSLKCFIVSFLDLQKQIANQLWEWFHATCSSSDSTRSKGSVNLPQGSVNLVVLCKVY